MVKEQLLKNIPIHMEWESCSLVEMIIQIVTST